MKLNIGGQKGIDKFPPGWTIVDIRNGADIQLDLNTCSLPIDDKSVHAIYTSHTLEHIFPDRLEIVLMEFYRVLKNDGIIRIVVPDIDVAIRAYLKSNREFLKDKNNPNKMDFLPSLDIYYLSSWFFSYRVDNQHRIFDGHTNVFNQVSLHYFLEKTGFKKIINRKYKKCSPVFKKCDFERYKNCSLYVEAIR